MEPVDDDALYFEPLEGFSRLADTYDLRLSGNPVLILETTQTLAALPNIAGKAVADIGCGTGRYAIQLMRLGAERVAGVDLSPAMLAVAQQKAQKAELPIEWGVGNLSEHIPIPDATLDAAVCALTLTFVASLRPAFAELARVLKPGGVLVISDLHPHGLTQERAASNAKFRKDHAPYLRFTDLRGQECRIPRHPHTLSEYVNAAYTAGLILTAASEPLVDSRLAVTFGGLQEKIGLPLALVLRFEKR
jgi:ubiquinone/menaquinone biosynthesis C-methylase UbiE